MPPPAATVVDTAVVVVAGAVDAVEEDEMPIPGEEDGGEGEEVPPAPRGEDVGVDGEGEVNPHRRPRRRTEEAADLGAGEDGVGAEVHAEQPEPTEGDCHPHHNNNTYKDPSTHLQLPLPH